MKALITPEDDSNDGIVLGNRAKVYMRNTIRTFTASRGITELKNGMYQVKVTMPPQLGELTAGTEKILGTYATNLEAALEHDLEIRRLWPAEQAERMVNMNLENTQRVSLLAETTPLLVNNWPEDELVKNWDQKTCQKLNIMPNKLRSVQVLHRSVSASSSSSSSSRSSKSESSTTRPYNKSADCPRW
jgi:hypothetical protein